MNRACMCVNCMCTLRWVRVGCSVVREASERRQCVCWEGEGRRAVQRMGALCERARARAIGRPCFQRQVHACCAW